MLWCSLLIVLYKRNIVVVENMLRRTKLIIWVFSTFSICLTKHHCDTCQKKSTFEKPSRHHHYTPYSKINALKEWRKCCSCLFLFLFSTIILHSSCFQIRPMNQHYSQLSLRMYRVFAMHIVLSFNCNLSIELSLFSLQPQIFVSKWTI